MLGKSFQSSLEGLRDFYAERLVDASDRDVAAIGRRLESVLELLEGLKGSDGGDSLDDELERRRLDKQGRVAGA